MPPDSAVAGIVHPSLTIRLISSCLSIGPRRAFACANIRGLLDAGASTTTNLQGGPDEQPAQELHLGHASITETYDRYGHLMPGNETEAAALMDDYLSAGTG